MLENCLVKGELRMVAAWVECSNLSHVEITYEKFNNRNPDQNLCTVLI